MPKPKKKDATITSFGRAEVRSLHAEIQKALEPIAAKHGLRLERKHCTYAPDEMPVSFKLLVTKLDADGNVMSTEAKDFVKYAKSYGFEPSDLGREFKIGRDTYRLYGLKPRSRKYPILAENVRTGKIYKFTAFDSRIKLEGDAA